MCAVTYDGANTTRRDGISDNGLWTWQEIALWASIASILAAAIGFSWNANPLAQAFAAIFIACALIRRSCLWSAPSLNPVCFVQHDCAHRWKALGFHFGSYHFELGADFPHIGLVPLIIGPFWFGLAIFRGQ
ncbi:hypothetical protein QA635_34250 [Bradyrhizobium brasilense]|uniref:hypothetical protein n=1 Tax=Bradyrhizobium brasilense TaxID=1419277 RepID=UPI0024B03B27|nr:hypothetical protein [Bradyrhizobium australafricanum]WFU31537.1 hypothetical protein QA635_34250 [Bradyrhizobium australafricanum]